MCEVPGAGGLLGAAAPPASRRPVLPPGDLLPADQPETPGVAGGGDRALGVVAELLARRRGADAGLGPLSYEQAVSRLSEICSALIDPEGRAVVPECLTFEQAADYLGISRSKLYAMHDAGLTPAPVELGDGCKRLLRRELFAWLIAGTPSRVRWVSMRDAVLRRVA